MTAQIISFPVKNPRNPRVPPSDVGAQVAVDTMKSQHIHETLLAISPMLFERLHAAGFDFADFKSEEELKYGSFLIEAMHSLLSKYYGLYHPFQTVAEQIFVRDKEDGDFSVTDELHLKFVDAEQPKT
jgi:hypothetical protein